MLPGLELRLYDPVSGQWLLTPQERSGGAASGGGGVASC